MSSHKSLAALFLAGAFAFTVAACGDDSVNPSTPPDASSARDGLGAGEADSSHPETGEDGGSGGDAADETGEASD